MTLMRDMEIEEKCWFFVMEMRISKLCSELENPFFFNIPIHWYTWVRAGRNIKDSMLYFHWENTNSKSKKLQRNISDNYDRTFGIF